METTTRCSQHAASCELRRRCTLTRPLSLPLALLLCPVFAVRLVGKGSFGSVYLVSRRRDGAQFVLKNMQINNLPDKEIEVRSRDRGRKQWELGKATDSGLSHPNDACALLLLLLRVASAQSYQNEVALLTALEHPGIVSHIESFIDGDRQHMCIVMGYDHFAQIILTPLRF